MKKKTSKKKVVINHQRDKRICCPRKTRKVLFHFLKEHSKTKEQLLEIKSMTTKMKNSQTGWKVILRQCYKREKYNRDGKQEEKQIKICVSIQDFQLSNNKNSRKKGERNRGEKIKNIIQENPSRLKDIIFQIESIQYKG